MADGKSKKIIDQLSSDEHARQAAENRKILRSVVETIMLCGRQELALRGNQDFGNVVSESWSTAKDGNFRDLLRFRVSCGDSVLKKHLESGSGNAQYTSPLIQKSINSDLW